MIPSQMRIVVIGGTHFIGPHVVGSLKGHEVVVLHRGRGCADATHIHTDRTRLPAGLHGDVVIDMWCMTEEHAKTLVDHFRDERLVVMSSGDVYRNYDGLRGRYTGAPDPIPLREDAPLRETRYPYPGSDYDKILVEEIVRGPRATILRLPAVYGPNDEQHRFAAWLQPDAKIDVKQAGWRWTRGYVENVAHAIILAALSDRAAGRTFNVGEPDAPTEQEWASMVAGRDVESAANVPGTLPVNFEYHLATDTTAIRRELGYAERIARPDAIAATVGWERSHSTTTA
jgi:nucleoside-diphosphate-sugar epimerase